MIVEQFPGGHSNLTYLVHHGDREYVLRRPPFGSKVKSAHDMSREVAVLSKLAPVYARAPRVFVCPTDGGTAQTVGGETFFPLTYFFNVNLSASRTPGGLPLSALTAPSATVLVTEVTGGFTAQPARLNDPESTIAQKYRS